MKTSLLLIIATTSEKIRAKELFQKEFIVIDELADFFYLQEELDKYCRLTDHYGLEEMLHIFHQYDFVIAFTSNISRIFWTKHLKLLRSEVDVIQIFQMCRLKEQFAQRGCIVRSSLYLKTLKKFLLFWDHQLKVRNNEHISFMSEYLEGNRVFIFKPIGLHRLEHLKQIAGRHEITLHYLEKTQGVVNLQFFYEHCLGLMLKQILGLFDDYKLTRHSYSQGSISRKRYSRYNSFEKWAKNQDCFLWRSRWRQQKKI